jgi:hypothetical protein
VLAGSHAGATVISGFAALSLTDSMKAELVASQFSVTCRTATCSTGSNHVIMPQWRISPF